MANKPAKKTAQIPAPKNKISALTPQKTKNKLSISMKLAILLAIISCIVYANTLKNGFVLDDSNLITRNSIVTKGIPAIPEILSTPYRRGYWKASNDAYRPLSLVMFAVEYQFFGNNPAPGHFINILLYAACVILLFIFFDQLFSGQKIAVAFIASLLFAVHPVHTEVVANIKSRDELLCFFFAFLCLNVLIKYMQTGKIKQLLLGSFCFLLSLLSKETSITFLAIIPLFFFFYRNENKKYGLYILIGTSIAALTFLIARHSVLSAYGANNTSIVPFIDNSLAREHLSFESRIATTVLVMGQYIKLLFIPYPLVCIYSYNSIPFVGFSDIRVLISLAFYIFLVVFCVRRFLRDQKDPYVFGILFFLITFALFSNIPFLIGATMGERFMFFPSAGFCLVLAVLIEKWIGKTTETGTSILKNPKVLGIIIPVCIVYAFIAINRNRDWSDNYTLYSTDVKKAPDDAHLNCLLGNFLTEEILSMDTAAIQKDPAEKKNIYDEAINYLTKSLAIYPGYEDAEKSLATVYINNKRYPEAIDLLKKLIRSNPIYINAQFELGRAYYSIEQYDSAEMHERIAVAQDPGNVAAINELAGTYFFRKQYPQAMQLYKNATVLNPGYVNPYANVAVCYLYLEKYDSAIYYANKAVSVNSSFNLSYEILAATYKAANKTDLAKKYEAIAQKNNPAFKL